MTTLDQEYTKGFYEGKQALLIALIDDLKCLLIDVKHKVEELNEQ